MRSRYEVWRYSPSWGKWIRDIYPDGIEAARRYESLLRKGKTARPPRPFNSGLPLADRVGFMVSRLFRRTNTGKPARRKLGA